MAFDPRTTPARPDLAAAHLADAVAAPRYVEGAVARVIEGLAPLRRQPRPDAGLDTEAVYGEAVTVYAEDDEGWAWVQLADDGYVGYLPSSAILKGVRPEPTHRVTALRTFVYPGPSIKEPPVTWLTFGSQVAITREIEAGHRRFGVLDTGAAVVMGHLGALDDLAEDPVAVAERFLGTPYLWGGKSSLGIDCSGLVQTALAACGIGAPRDSDQQEAALGQVVGLDPEGWQRGDLLFWPGHVALVRDEATILHANAHSMTVAIEPTAAALDRIEAAGSSLRTVKRLG